MKDIEGSNTWGLKLITSLMKELETVMLIVTITTSQGLKPMASWVRLMTDTKLEASQVPISQSFTKTMKENKKQIRQSYNSWVGAPGLPRSYMLHNVHEDVIKNRSSCIGCSLNSHCKMTFFQKMINFIFLIYVFV